MRPLPIALAVVALAGAPLRAQDPYSQGGGGGGFDQSRAREGERQRRPSITDDQLEGPPYPQFMSMRFELDSTESTAYRQLYDSFMVATKPLRDSARVARDGGKHGGGGAGGGAGEATTDPAGFMRNMDRMDAMRSALEKSEKEFDKGVKKVLTSAHYKDYKQWRDEQKKIAEEQEFQKHPPRPNDR